MFSLLDGVCVLPKVQAQWPQSWDLNPDRGLVGQHSPRVCVHPAHTPECAAHASSRKAFTGGRVPQPWGHTPLGFPRLSPQPSRPSAPLFAQLGSCVFPATLS